MTNSHAHVVITGASSGIGQATAEAFAARGARLVLAARGVEALERVASRCRAAGALVLAVPTDVKDPQAVQALAQTALSFLGRIDLWFSNVGVGAVGKFHQVPIEASEEVVRANLLGHMHDAHAVVPMFIKQGFGTFVNMISMGGFVAAPYAAAYSASKFGLRGFSEALRAELSGYPRIHICDVYPYFVDTPGLAHGANYTARRVCAPPPVLDPRQVAAAVVRLARRPRPTVVVGSGVHAMRLGHALAPQLVARLMGQCFDRYFARAALVAVSTGNVFEPPAVAGDIDGGLRKPPRDRNLAKILGAAGVGVALTAALLLQTRRARA